MTKKKGGTKKNQEIGHGSILSFFKPSDKPSTSKEPDSSSPNVNTANSKETSSPHIHNTNAKRPLPSIIVDTSNDDNQLQPKHQRVEIDLGCLERDPALRTPIWKYHVNQRDEVRRAYIMMGPFQPILKYPGTIEKGDTQKRYFKKRWFNIFKWLEYSPSKDAAFCFPCWLFHEEDPRYRTFTVDGYSSWKYALGGERGNFLQHVGCGPTSIHKNSEDSMKALGQVVGHVDKVMNVQSAKQKKGNRLRLGATIRGVRWLTLQACALRGHKESKSSTNRGNLIEMIELLRTLNDDINDVVLEKAPKNAQYISPKVQKDILHILGNGVRNKIREEVGKAKFCILVDEAKDSSNKEQMSIVLRYVDVRGCVQEHFFDIVHVVDTTAATLKKGISKVLNRHKLNIEDLRGQGYDGASNMRGAWNGLQALFLKDSPHAYYIHCFAHKLQLALVAAAENEPTIWLFFSKLTTLVNLIKVSPKRHTALESAQAIEVAEMVATGERETGKGANQLGTLQRAGKTRWSSHFDSTCSLIDMFGAVITVLGHMVIEASSNAIRGEAAGSLEKMKTFDFIFILHLMNKTMGITDLLCKALQQKSLDILNAMRFVTTTKGFLNSLRSDGYDIHLECVMSVCAKHDVEIPDFDATYRGVSRRSGQVSNGHHYRFDVFNAAIDYQVQEISSRFNEEAMELLKLSTALEPNDNYKLFQVDDICTLAEKFYPQDFSKQDMHYLRSQLSRFEYDIIPDVRFQELSSISELCQKLVETKMAPHFNMVDRLLRLVLTLPVSTASAERSFSAMKLVKTALRNKMGKGYLADSMSVYIEREIASSISEDSIIDDFYKMRNRRAQLM